MLSQKDEDKKIDPMLFIARDGKVKKAFVIEVDDIYDVELIQNLLDDPAQSIMQFNSDIVLLNTHIDSINFEKIEGEISEKTGVEK